MTKRSSLADYDDEPTPAAAPAPAATTPRKAAAKATTEEVIQVAYRLPRSRWKKLRDLATDQRRPAQALITEALEAYFKKQGLPF